MEKAGEKKRQQKEKIIHRYTTSKDKEYIHMYLLSCTDHKAPCQETNTPILPARKLIIQGGISCSGLLPRQEAGLPDAISPSVSQQPSHSNEEILSFATHSWDTLPRIMALPETPVLVPKAHTAKNRTMVWGQRKALCSGAGRKVSPVLTESGQQS